MNDTAAWFAGAAALLTSLAVITTYLRKFGKFAAKVGRGVSELAKLPAAVDQLAGALVELGTQHTARMDAHERELARLATFHPLEVSP